MLICLCMQCYCADSITGGSVLVAATDCVESCAGDADEVCGSADRLTVYTYTP